MRMVSDMVDLSARHDGTMFLPEPIETIEFEMKTKLDDRANASISNESMCVIDNFTLQEGGTDEAMIGCK